MQKRRHLENFQQTDPCCSTDAQSQAFLLTGPALPGEVTHHVNDYIKSFNWQVIATKRDG